MTIRHSYSSLRMHHQCPRAWAYKFLEGYEPVGTHEASLAALRGTAFHALIGAHYLSTGGDTLIRRPDKLKILNNVELAIDWSTGSPTVVAPDLGPEIPLTPWSVIMHIEAWENDQTEKLREAMIAKYGDTLSKRMHELWTRYLLHWSGEMDNWIPLLAETEWNRDAPNGRTLSGRVDLVVYNKLLGHIQVVDAKTHESWPTEPEEVTELFDGQLQLGAWGVAPILSEAAEHLAALGIEDTVPRSTCYDRVRFKKPTWPKLTQKGKLYKNITDFDQYTYEKFCASQEAKDAGYEPETFVWEKDAWFRRRSTPININIIRAHVLSYQDQILKAEETKTETAILIPSKDCGRCDFLELCVTELRGGRMYVEDHDLHLYGLQRKATQ